MPTAHDRTTHHAAAIATLLQGIASGVAGMQAAASQEPTNWGHTGSMAHVREQLQEVAGFVLQLVDEPAGRIEAAALQAAHQEDRQPKAAGDIDAILGVIAREHLSIDTLERANDDSRDFHGCAVWSIQQALRAAYESGRTNA